jgi:two-component system chemotaxis response regulator CheB
MTDGRKLIVVGGSAGAVEALRVLVRHLSGALPASVAVVIHGINGHRGGMTRMFSHPGGLEVSPAQDGEAMEPGHMYLATADRHLLVEDGVFRLSLTAEENRARPAIDPLFRSAAAGHGADVVGVILSGTLDDGSAGLLAIGEAGGRMLVQDPREALFPEMPTNAIRYAVPDAVLPIVDLAHELNRVVAEEAAVSERRHSRDDEPDLGNFGRVSGLTCPQCHGAMWERDLDGLIQYRCRTGHVLGQESMATEQDRMVEEALWAAVRALEERSELSRRVAERFEARGDDATAARHRRQTMTAARRTATLRGTVLSEDGPGD